MRRNSNKNSAKNLAAPKPAAGGKKITAPVKSAAAKKAAAPAKKAAAPAKAIAAKKATAAKRVAAVKGSSAPARGGNKKIKVIPLGGLHEIGKNLAVFEYGDDVLILDCGMAFPDDDMPGVDIVIPDITYLHKVADKIRGIVLTHGHEDHIGAIPYVLKEFNVPVYGTRLTLGILKNKLKEHGLLRSAKLNTLEAGESVKLGVFVAEFIHTNHSIADAVAIALHTPIGVLLHTGDFKIDPTPIDGGMIDLARIGELGKQGVLALFSDSTNADRPGYTMSESTIGKTFDTLFDRGVDKRIIVATFASNIHRVQQIINAAEKYGRKVAVSGRSMVNVLNAAIELGYMNISKNTLIDIDEIGRYPREKLVIVTTGSQGEPMSALTRIAFSVHRKINIEPTDMVIISASPIPGNEKAVSNVVNELLKHGAEVIHERQDNVHVSGHACQQELRIMISLANPKYFIPVHGEYRHLCYHRDIALQTGMDAKNIFLMDIGKVLEISKTQAKITGTVPSGKVLVDGLGVGDVGNIVLRDRKHLAEDGIIVVVLTIDKASGACTAGPDIISRGFVYVRESEDLMEAVHKVAVNVVDECTGGNTIDWTTLKTRIKNDVGGFLLSKTKRRPMILPIIMEV